MNISRRSEKRVSASLVVYLIILLAMFIGFNAIVMADDSEQKILGPSDVDPKYLQATPEDMQWWRDAKLGMFVCWGPVTMTGKEIGWARAGERRGTTGTGDVPVEIYDNLYKKWKPDKFDARQWAQVAVDLGAKYMIFLVKHHDGFCLYDSKLTDYKVTGAESAWKHDVMKDVADACHVAGLKLIIYYSQPDWHHLDYRTKNHHRYITYLHGQVCELLTDYGRVDGFWFDLGGKPEDWDSEKLFKMMRTIQPWLIINNRCGVQGDFDTPEQRLGMFQLERPWETCMTLGTQWSWKPDDEIKSLKQCIDVLVTCAVRNGNLALNTGPMPDGRIEPRQAARFGEIGQWMKKYGESIYGTRGGPFISKAAWGGSTRKGNIIYIHVLKWAGEPLRLPPIDKNIVSNAILTGGTVIVGQTGEGILIDVPSDHQRKLDTIIKLELDGSAMDIEPVVVVPEVLRGAISMGERSSASGEWSSHYSAAMAFDRDESTRWGGTPGSTSGWLAADLGTEKTFNGIFISEAYDRIRTFELQVKIGESWYPFFKGTTIGDHYYTPFPSITARHFRLNIQEATDVPTIWEVQLLKSVVRHHPR
jgi:alpha-L-fucosidase